MIFVFPCTFWDVGQKGVSMFLDHIQSDKGGITSHSFEIEILFMRLSCPRETG